MRSRASIGAAFALTAACYSAGWMAVAAYRADLDPERALEAGGSPSAPALALAAERRIASGVRALSDPAQAPAARLAHYREHLESAERLLLASASARPTDALTWVRLGAVGSELDPSDHGSARRSALMAGAQALTPERADVRRALADLSFDLGRTEEGLAHARQAIALDDRTCGAVVEALSRRGFAPAQIAAVVPAEARHLVTLAGVYFDEGQEREYIERVEPVLANEPDRQLLATWAHAHRRIGDWARLECLLGEMIERGTTSIAAQLMLERSRARLALGRAGAALADASEAFVLDPSSAVAAEQIGLAALAAGEPARAVEGLEAALRIGARGAADARTRARLYRAIGQAEESRLRFEPAYRAYGRALDLDPDEPLARERRREIERRGGVR